MEKNEIAEKVKVCHGCREIILIFPNNPKSNKLEKEFDDKHRGHMIVIDNVKNFDLGLFSKFKGDEL